MLDAMQAHPPPLIYPKDLALRLQAGEPALLIDVRSPAEYREIHADRAELHPLDSLDPSAIHRRMIETQAQAVYVFCRSGARATKGAALLQAAGLQNIFVVEGGTVAWSEAGLPVVRDAHAVLPLERQILVGSGALVVLGFLLGWLLHPTFFGLAAVTGCDLIFSGLTGISAVSMLLAKMPWNN